MKPRFVTKEQAKDLVQLGAEVYMSSLFPEQIVPERDNLSEYGVGVPMNIYDCLLSLHGWRTFWVWEE